MRRNKTLKDLCRAQSRIYFEVPRILFFS